MQSLLITAPAAGAITLTEAKSHLKVETSAEDTEIQAFINSATRMIEAQTGVKLVAQTWETQFAGFCGANWQIYLPIMPVISITHVKYYDTSNVLQTLDSAEYRLLAGWNSRAKLEAVNQWPATYCRSDAVQIRYSCGFATVPDDAKQAAKFAVALFHMQRSGEVIGTITKKLEFGIDKLCSGLRGY